MDYNDSLLEKIKNTVEKRFYGLDKLKGRTNLLVIWTEFIRKEPTYIKFKLRLRRLKKFIAENKLYSFFTNKLLLFDFQIFAGEN